MNGEIVLRRVSSHSVRFGGEEHQGWLPQGAITPEPTPEAELRLELEIRAVEGGFLLDWRPVETESQHVEAPFAGDLWFESIEEAEEAALKSFGVPDGDWEDLS
jgi:hypothetical protein